MQEIIKCSREQSPDMAEFLFISTGGEEEEEEEEEKLNDQKACKASLLLMRKYEYQLINIYSLCAKCVLLPTLLTKSGTREKEPATEWEKFLSKIPLLSRFIGQLIYCNTAMLGS